MKCPICKAELESKGFQIVATNALSFYYCSNCDNNLQYDGKEAWDVILPVECYICLVQREEVLEGKHVRHLTIIEGGRK